MNLCKCFIADTFSERMFRIYFTITTSKSNVGLSIHISLYLPGA
nr:MAG TPA: hypothetical protein [Caudoviricetes sp.]